MEIAYIELINMYSEFVATLLELFSYLCVNF